MIYLTAENSDLKAALPELEITKADLTARSWPEPEPEAPVPPKKTRCGLFRWLGRRKKKK